MTATNPFRTGPSLEVRLAPEAVTEGRIEGYGSIFGVVDDHGDIVQPGAFLKSLGVRMPVMVWSHDLARPIGRWDQAVEDQRGLFLRGQLNLQTDDGRMAHAHLRAGDVKGLSIGFRTPEGGAVVDIASGLRRMSNIDLFEVSPVVIPSMPGAVITEVRSISRLESERELRAALHSIGLSQGAAKKIAAGGWPALNGVQDQPQLTSLARRVSAATAEISTKG